MVVRRIILGSAIAVAGLCAHARGDICQTPQPASASLHLNNAPAPVAAPTESLILSSPQTQDATPFPWPAEMPPAAGNPNRDPIETLPPLPGSARLFFSALLGVGAWQLLRNAGQIHLNDIPSWYHSGGPVQVAHSVPYDFDQSPVPCWLPPLPAREQNTREYGWQDRNRSCRSQWLPLAIVPRGPPSQLL